MDTETDRLFFAGLMHNQQIPGLLAGCIVRYRGAVQDDWEAQQIFDDLRILRRARQAPWNRKRRERARQAHFISPERDGGSIFVEAFFI